MKNFLEVLLVLGVLLVAYLGVRFMRPMGKQLVVCFSSPIIMAVTFTDQFLRLRATNWDWDQSSVAWSYSFFVLWLWIYLEDFFRAKKQGHLKQALIASVAGLLIFAGVTARGRFLQ